MAIDPATVTRGITYLYRWWLQAELGIVPKAYIRRAAVATLVAPEWAIAASPEPVDATEVECLAADLNTPVYLVCPSLPSHSAGLDLHDGCSRNLPDALLRVAAILEKNQLLLHQLGEENPERNEWWNTRDAGAFKVWSGRTHRLLLYPSDGRLYGFAVSTGADGGYFFFRSRSCREEGRVVKTGVYKNSEHALPSGRKVTNLDLLFSDGNVLLLRLSPTGAGFKVFPRRVPGHEGSLE